MDLSTSYTIKAQVTGQDQISGLTKGLGKLKTNTNNAATAMGKLKTMAGQALGALRALAPAIGIAGMGKLVNDTLVLGDELGKLEEQTGITVPTLDKLRQAADLAGVDFKKVGKSLGIMSKSMADFNEGKGLAVDTLEILDVDPFDHVTQSMKSMDQVLFEVMDAMSNMPAGYDKVNMAMDIFGGQGMKLIPLLNMQSEGIKKLDSAFSNQFADRIEKFNDSMAQLGERFNFLKFSLTESLLPALELAVGAFTKVAVFLKNLPKPIQSAVIAFGLLAPAILALAPIIASLIVSFKIIAKIKLGVVIAKIATSFGLVVTAVKGAIVAFAPLLAAGAIPAAIIGLGVLIFKFRDQIGAAFQAIGQFIHDALSPITNFIGGVFNGAMDMARNAFNRLPNIVQQAIKAATAPLRGFIKFLQRILKLLGIVKGAQANPPTTSSSSTSTSTSTSSSSTSTSSLPYTSGYQESDLSVGNVGSGYAGTTYTIPSSNPSTISATQLPSGGYSISQNSSNSSSSPPNINIQTGNVTQIDGTNYVTTSDLQQAVQSATTQTMNYIQAGGVTHYL